MFSGLGRFPFVLCTIWLAMPPATSKKQEDSLVLISGNVTIAALMEVNEAVDDTCSDYDVQSLQEVMAVSWLVNSLNEMNYIPGIKIGLDVYRTCKLPAKAARGAVTLLNKYGVGQENINTASRLFGILGPSRTAEAIPVSSLIGYLPTNQHLLQISGSSTGRQLSDRSLHPNFFRVIPPDGIQVKVMLQLLLQLQWNYVAIVYDDDDYGRTAAEELRRLAEGRQLCIPVFVSLPLDFRSSAFSNAASNVAQQLKSSGGGPVRGLVVFGGTSTTRQLLQILDREVAFTQLVLSETVGLNTALLKTTSGAILSLAKGALVTSPPYIQVPEFASFWSSLWTNESQFSAHADRFPWLAGYFTQLTGCDVGEAGCWDQSAQLRTSHVIQNGGELSVYIGYQVKAAAVMAALLKRLHDNKCGSNHSGLCPDLENSIAARHVIQHTLENSAFSLDYLSSVTTAFSGESSVRFDNNGDIIMDGDDGDYTVYNLKTTGADLTFQQVGTFDNDNLTMKRSETKFYDENGFPLTWNMLPPAQCDVNHDCLKCEHDVSGDVIFVEGDFYVIGLLPISTKNPNNLLQCGQIKGLVGADLAQAVVFAVQEVNRKTGVFSKILPGRRVGLVVINTCASPPLVRQRLMDLYAGKLALSGGRNSSELLGRMMGVVGALYSADSIAASDTLTSLERTLVLVSPASTSPELKDRRKYPYFMRLVPADDTQAQAMLDIVQKIGGNYIQVIYDSSTAYATALFHKLQEETTTSDRHKVCIAQSIAITPHKKVSQYKYIVDKLRDKSAARIIIVILHIEEIKKVMGAILPQLTSDDNFLFLASEGWGRRQEIIDGKTRLQGSLVLAQEIAVDKVFEQHFASLKPSESHNPWLNRFWEARLNCYMNKSFRRKGKAGPCPENVGEDYKQDSLVPLCIQSTYAVVKGFDAALRQHCGRQASSTCESLNSSLLVSAMHDVQLDLYSTGQTSRVFDANGDGLVGYKVLEVSRGLTGGGNSLIYKDVGSWMPAEGLSLKHENQFLPGGAGFSSICPNSLECNRCFPSPPTTPHSSAQENGLPPSVTIGVGTVCGIVIVILVVVIVYLSRRRRYSPEPRGPYSSSFSQQEMSGDWLWTMDTASPHYATISVNDGEQPLEGNPPVSNDSLSPVAGRGDIAMTSSDVA